MTQPGGPAAGGGQSSLIDLLWRRAADSAPRRGPKPALSIELIAATGVDIADADGLAALTMQRVADALGFTKMALYRYVPGKDELVALMTESAVGVPPQLEGAGWRTRLEVWTTRLFDRFVRHPWALQTTVGARVMGPNELSWLEQALDALSGTGLTGAEMLDVAVTLIGQARAIAEQWAAAGEDQEKAVDDTLVSLLVGQQDRFPALIRALRSAAEHPGDRNQALDFGVNRILDGVDLLIANRT